MRITLSIILFFLWSNGYSQMSNEKCRWVKDFNKPLILDSLSVIPGSVKADDNITIEQNISTGTITIIQNAQADSVLLCYKVYPFAFHQRVYNRDLSVYDSNAVFKDPVKPSTTLHQEELFHTEVLYKSGSITRGVSFGNSQNVFVNSSLNLNLDGQLADNLYIRASITDQNIPYQPEGNTQQLQDFDNVFVEVYNDNFSLIGGDVVFQNVESYFLKYYKNVQGGTTSLKYDIGSGKAKTSIGASVAKGRFASVIIPASEGLSGPYRIPGPNSEKFILVLANSEKVFLDGEQLQRGYDNDYVIDYNIGEITFTNNILITQFSRIRVDYEYSDQNYSRTITSASHHQEIGNLKIRINAYSEKDNRNRPLLYDLSDDQKVFLSEIGDDLDQALYESVDSVGYSQESVLYKKIITTDSNGNDLIIYQYSTNADSAVFRVSFSDVGLSNGDYRQVLSTANGRIFEYIPPVNGVKQGQYAPVIVLPAPNKKQMVSVAAEYTINDYETVFTEVAFSDMDLNLFSDIDNENNAGYAVKSGIVSTGREVVFIPDYKFSASLDVEIDDKNFSPIDRFRYIEYDRDWNYDPSQTEELFQDQIINAGIGIEKDAGNSVHYNITHRNRGNQVNGFQHRIRANKRFDKIQLKSNYFLMKNNQDEFKARWERMSADLSYMGGIFIPGYRFSTDKNIVKSSSDSIQYSGMYFEDHTGYLTNGESGKWDFDISHSYREDYRPQEGSIAKYSLSNTTHLGAGRDFGRHAVKVISNYRKIDYEQDIATEETIAGRTDWLGSWLDNHLRTEMTYAIANSQELKREFVYIKVPIGQGTHTWRDLNEDGIQDLGEFFEAINPDERNYVKIFTPTNEFISAFQNTFIFRVNADAPRSWSNAGGIKKIASKFSNSTSWSSDTKTTEKSISTRLLAFAKDINDDVLLVENNYLRSTLFYNRTHPVYGLDFTYSASNSKQLLTNGFEQRELDDLTTTLRLNLTKEYSLNIQSQRTVKNVKSDFLIDRNYLLNINKISPQLSWRPNNFSRYSIQYSLTDKKNAFNSESYENATFNEIIGEIKLSKAIKSNFSVIMRWAEIDFTGEENSPVGYDMLEALRPGRNVIWTVNWQQKITKGLQLNLSYNGRKSEDNDAIHIGRVQVSALF